MQNICNENATTLVLLAGYLTCPSVGVSGVGKL